MVLAFCMEKKKMRMRIEKLVCQITDFFPY